MAAPFEMVMVKEEPVEYSEYPDNPVAEESATPEEVPIPTQSSSEEPKCQSWFACVFCHKTFKEAPIVMEHAQAAHRQDYVCHKCKNKFQNKASLFAHQIQDSCKEQPYYYVVMRDTVKYENNYVKLTDKKPIKKPASRTEGIVFTNPIDTFQNEAFVNNNDTLNEEKLNIPLKNDINHHENISFLRQTFNASFSAKNSVVVPCIYCPTCDKNFDVNFYMDSHLDTQNSVACRCPFCMISTGFYKCNIQFAKHIVQHFRGKSSLAMYHCNTQSCYYTFFSNMNLNNHRKTCAPRELECKPAKSVSDLLTKEGWMSALNYVTRSLKNNAIKDNPTLIPSIYCAQCKSDFNIEFYMLRHIVQNIYDKMTCHCFMCGEKSLDTARKYILHLQSHIMATSGKTRMDMFLCSRAHCNAAFFTVENQCQHYRDIHMKALTELENPCSGLLYDSSDSLSNMKKCTYEHMERHRSNVYEKSKLWPMMIHCCTCCNALPFQTYIFKHIDASPCCLITCPFCKNQTTFTPLRWFSHFWANHSGFTNHSAFCHECNYAFYNGYNLAAHVKEEHSLIIKEDDLQASDFDYVFPARKNFKKIKHDTVFTMDQPSSSGAISCFYQK